MSSSELYSSCAHLQISPPAARIIKYGKRVTLSYRSARAWEAASPGFQHHPGRGACPRLKEAHPLKA
eukprot:1147904-Pelagomonas_calceolata.AAC.2